MIFLDTCYSGSLFPGSQRLRLGRWSGTSTASPTSCGDSGPGIIVFTSSSGNEFSWEYPGLGNGAFTRALLDAVRGEGDFKKRGVVRVSDLESYVPERVKVLTNGQSRSR